MPGFYPPGRYDLAGFCTAVVEESNLIDGQKMQVGNQIIAIASSGFHSNGFSLVRKVLSMHRINEKSLYGPEKLPLIDDLLKPTNLYVPLVKALLKAEVPIHGMAHITGGGLPENLPRCLPDGLRACVDPKAWIKPDIFRWIQEAGQIPEIDLWNTFNLGVGFCLVVDAEVVKEVLEICENNGFDSWVMGKVEETCSSQPADLVGLPI